MRTNVLLDVTGGVAGFGIAGALSGAVTLSRHAQIEFASGQINTILSGASLTLVGASASIFDATNTAANSALAGLTLIAGALDLEDGARLTTSGAINNINTLDIGTSAGNTSTSLTSGGAFNNNGVFALDNDSDGRGGSSLIVKGALTNNDAVYLGSNFLSQSSTVRAVQRSLLSP